MHHVSPFLSPRAAQRIRVEIERARGNEVCFLCRLDEEGAVVEARVVARGRRDAVVAATREGEAGMLVVHNHPSGELEPSHADMRIATQLHDLGLGLAIVDNAGSELYVVVEPASRRERRLLDPDDVDAALGPGGRLSRAHAAYEDRATQRQMARAIATLFNEGGIRLAEAGTGTGKSVAYLLPAIRWAAANRERVVVSTNTINLQEQLVGKDLPLLRRMLDEPFRFALVKGRSNYISIRRAKLAAAAQGSLFEKPHERELTALLSWLETTADGSLQDLPFQPAPEVWEEVASETDVCLRAKCPHFQQCFYQQARREAALADVLVVNHSLLFSDLALRYAQQNYTAPAVLPPYRHVIIDEAHNLEESATSHLGARVSRRGLLRALGRVDRRGKGILLSIEQRLLVDRSDDLLRQNALHEIDELRPLVERTRDHAALLFDRLQDLVTRAPDGVLRMGDEFPATAEWTASLEPVFENLTVSLAGIVRGVRRLIELIMADRDWATNLAEPLLELQAAAGRLQSGDDALRLVLAPPAAETVPMVRWVERRGPPGDDANVALHAAPVEIGDALRDALFERADTVVLTSATLTTRDGFGFLRGRLGLNAGGLRIHEEAYPSPFEFETQTVIAIPTDLPTPGASDGPFDLATARVALDMARLSDGGLFVLFTSYRAMRAIAAELRRNGASTKWPLFVQGEGSRARLLERFTDSGRGILLGVSSFWEGVDVPGEPLRALLIAKLPFMVPNEPLTAARLEAIERYGGSGFRDYLLPHAALRLKQGFGRLIRARTDRGAVVLLDRRVLEKGYGRYFLDSLPPAPVESGRWETLLQGLERFYAASALLA